MYCEKCGTFNQDGSKFCKKCGAPMVMNVAPSEEQTTEFLGNQAPISEQQTEFLGNINMPTEHFAPSPAPEFETVSVVNDKPKKKSKAPLILFIISLLLLIGSVIFYFVITSSDSDSSKRDRNKDKNKTESNSAAEGMIDEDLVELLADQASYDLEDYVDAVYEYKAGDYDAYDYISDIFHPDAMDVRAEFEECTYIATGETISIDEIESHVYRDYDDRIQVDMYFEDSLIGYAIYEEDDSTYKIVEFDFRNIFD